MRRLCVVALTACNCLAACGCLGCMWLHRLHVVALAASGCRGCMCLPSLHVVAWLHVLAWLHVVAFAASSCLDCMRLPWLHVVGLAAFGCLGCIRLPWLHVLALAEHVLCKQYAGHQESIAALNDLCNCFCRWSIHPHGIIHVLVNKCLIQNERRETRE